MMMKKSKNKSGLVYSTNPDAMVREEEEEVQTLAPEKQILKVRIDKKGRAGKTVTLVQGFIGNESDLNDLAKKIKTKCGTGGSAKEGEIIIQGDYRESIKEWLKTWGYKAS